MCMKVSLRPSLEWETEAHVTYRACGFGMIPVVTQAELKRQGTNHAPGGWNLEIGKHLTFGLICRIPALLLGRISYRHVEV